MPAGKQVLSLRSRTLKAIRAFFDDRGFTEVETPVRLPAPALEAHIEAEPSGRWFLRTSPELHMKRLLADGCERIYQLGPCFRRGERGQFHQPEYTMLEWYRTDADYMDMLVDTKTLIDAVTRQVLGRTNITYQDTPVDIMPVWECLSVSEAFLQHAGWDPVRNYDPDRFDLDLVNKVEPQFPKKRPLVLKDYPAAAAALARTTTDTPPVAERWELYIAGLELANAFTELTDPAEQRQRFEKCARARRENGQAVYPLDEPFLAALEKGLPPCGGVALGVDRLVMLLANAAHIDDVRAFAV